MRIKTLFIAIPTLLVAGYLGESWHIMSKNIDEPILAITTDAVPGIPRSLAKAYLYLSNYDPNACDSFGMPLFNFIVAGYGDKNSHNEAILQLSQKFIDKGANINKSWHGLTPLQAAVLGNEPVLVQHLLQNNADQNIRFKLPGKPTNNMTALEYAEYLTNQKQQDRSEIIAVFNTFNKQHNPALKPALTRVAPGIS